METGYNIDLYSQIDIFCEIIMKNKILNGLFTRAPSLGPKNYYIGAGCLAHRKNSKKYKKYIKNRDTYLFIELPVFRRILKGLRGFLP